MWKKERRMIPAYGAFFQIGFDDLSDNFFGDLSSEPYIFAKVIP